jgi:predicted  nucleic acid-binding Zn-ribbon protein
MVTVTAQEISELRERARAQEAALTKTISTLKESLSAVTRERDELKDQLARLQSLLVRRLRTPLWCHPCGS